MLNIKIMILKKSNGYFNARKMFRILSFTGLFVIQLSALYSQCDSINCNKKLTGSFGNYGQYQTRNNFYDGLVPCWIRVKGTPHLSPNVQSSPSAAMIYSYYANSYLNSLDNESFGQYINLKQGHRYILKYQAVRDSGGMINNGSIIVRFYGSSTYQIPACNGGTSAGLTFSWAKYGGCFTAPRNTGFISFESIPLNTNNAPAVF